MRRLDSLTSMRFFAAMAVVIYHAATMFGLPPRVVRATGPGFLGVTFFFVLSGFVLTWSRSSSYGALNFYLNRFARVWPTHLMTAGVALMLAPASALAVGMNLLLIQAWVPKADINFGVNGVSWTLSCEGFFYAVFPFLVTKLEGPRSPKRALVVGYLAYVVVGAVVASTLPSADAFFALYVLPAYRVGEFALGVLLAHSLIGGWRPSISPPAAVSVMFVPVVALEVFLPFRPDQADGYWVYDVAALPGVILVLAAVAHRDAGGRGVLQHPVLMRLGTWSFALYLSHQLVMRWLSRHGLGPVLALLLVIPVAGLLHTLWERPWERWLRRQSRVGAPTPTQGGQAVVPLTGGGRACDAESGG